MQIKRIVKSKTGLQVISEDEINEANVGELLKFIIFYLRFNNKNIKHILVKFSDYEEDIRDGVVLRKCVDRAKEISKIVRRIAISKKYDIRNIDLESLSVYPNFGEAYDINYKISLEKMENKIRSAEDRTEDTIEEVEFPERMSHIQSNLTKDNVLVVRYVDKKMKRLVLDTSYFLRWIINDKLLQPGKFEEFIKYRYVRGVLYLKGTNPTLSEETLKSVAIHSTFASMGLPKLSPLFFDKKITEIYLDNEDGYVYIEHMDYGRIRTNIRPKVREVKALIAALRRNSGQELSLLSPSAKGDLSFHTFILRTSIDTFPIVENFAVDIRKLSKEPISLCDLIRNGSLNEATVQFLKKLIELRANISIVGEPGSGKTTLLSAIARTIPKYWRTILIEDVPEVSLSFPNSNFHLKIYVDPFDTRNKTRKKSEEIIKLLHRNPTYVILGELQYKDHFRALFYALSSGLRVIHTAHAPDPLGFVDRIINVYKISPQLVPYIDIIIGMKRIENKNGNVFRKVDSVCLLERVETKFELQKMKVVKLEELSEEELKCIFNEWINLILEKKNEKNVLIV